MAIPIVQIDAFTAEPFAGNPAAVCLRPEMPEADWMQAVAREMNLSETAFLVPADDGFRLRWFTPAVEVDLCGHATLASAHFLWQEGVLSLGEEARFHTRSGLLTARREGDWIAMDFPSDPPAARPPAPGLAEALGVKAVWSGAGRLYQLLAVGSAAELRRARPDFGRLRRACPVGVVVTSPSDDPRFDFLSRFFGPNVGVDEDPVTGSAHCMLAPYWSERLGRGDLTGFQASARGGEVRTRLAGERVILAGQAVTVMRGELV